MKVKVRWAGRYNTLGRCLGEKRAQRIPPLGGEVRIVLCRLAYLLEPG